MNGADSWFREEDPLPMPDLIVKPMPVERNRRAPLRKLDTTSASAAEGWRERNRHKAEILPLKVATRITRR